MPPTGILVEVKEALDGSAQQFPLERWLWTPDCVVGRWYAAELNPYGLPPGATSWGVWWRARPYGAYRLHAPDGSLLGYRFDALSHVRIGEAEVRYRDLLLDARIDVPGNVRLEDEDEVEAARTAGRITAHEHRRLRCLRELFLQRAAQLTARVDAEIEAAEA